MNVLVNQLNADRHTSGIIAQIFITIVHPKIQHSITYPDPFEWIEGFTIFANFGNKRLIANHRRKHWKVTFRVQYAVRPRD